MADEESKKPGEFVPMSADDREEFLPPMVLRQTKVGGASIKTTEHPSYMQALEQCPYDTGARSSTDAAPRRYVVQDRFRNHDDAWDDDHHDSPWYEDKRGNNQWKDASSNGRDYDRYRR